MSNRAGVAARGRDGRGGEAGCKGRGGGRGGGRNNQRARKLKHVSKTPAIKDDVLECGSVRFAAQFERSNKAVIKYIRREGSKEPVLIAEALETNVAPVIVVPPPPRQIEDPMNPGTLINDQAGMFIWQSSVKHVPI